MPEWNALKITSCSRLIDGLNDALDQYRERASDPESPVTDFDAGVAHLWFVHSDDRKCYDAELELTPEGRNPVVVKFTLMGSLSFLVHENGRFTCREAVSADQIEAIHARPVDPFAESA